MDLSSSALVPVTPVRVKPGVRSPSAPCQLRPFTLGSTGFTGVIPRKGQLPPVFCRIVGMSVRAYCPFPLFGPSSDVPTTLPSADSCTAITGLATRSVRLRRTLYRPPRVSSTAFPAHPPNLPPRRIDGADFAIIRSLVRPGRPRIRFLFIGSQVCSTLPSDPASRRRPCASLILRRHLAG